MLRGSPEHSPETSHLFENDEGDPSDVFRPFSPRVSLLQGLEDMVQQFLPSVRPFRLVGAFTLAVISLFLPISSFGPAQRCFSILVLSASLWATEAIPLYVTSLMIPLLVVLGRVLVDPDTKKVVDAHTAAVNISGQFFSPTVILFMAGFAIGSALNKERIPASFGHRILSRVQHRPRLLVLTTMFFGYFLSMWISNVPAAVLSISLVMPLVHSLDPKDNYVKQLLMGVAIACNLGGMTTPIASPQNAIGLQTIEQESHGEVTMGFGEWMLFAIPLSSLFMIAGWLLLIVLFPSQKESISLPQPEYVRFGFRQYFVIFTTLLTVMMWATSNVSAHIFGHMGIISLIPIILLFGSGIMTTRDFDALTWNVLILIGGGIALGYAMDVSTLLESISKSLLDHLHDSSTWIAMTVFVILVGVIGNFISHTVSAIIIIPIVAKVGLTLGHPKILVLGPVLLCSGSMSLPVSSFPNANVYSLHDQHNERYMKTSDYLKAGATITIIIIAMTATLGYAWMLALGF